MALTRWKELDRTLDTLKSTYDRETVPYWSSSSYWPYWRRSQWYKDYGLRSLNWWEMPREYRDFERRSREMLGNETKELTRRVDKDGFKVVLDVLQYGPNDITVKTDDDQVIIEGRREESGSDLRYLSRQFTRRYTLPLGYDPCTVTAQMSSDGFMTIKALKAPFSRSLVASKSYWVPRKRYVSILQRGPAYLEH